MGGEHRPKSKHRVKVLRSRRSFLKYSLVNSPPKQRRMLKNGHLWSLSKNSCGTFTSFSWERKRVISIYPKCGREVEKNEWQDKKLPAGKTYPCVIFNLRLLWTPIHQRNNFSEILSVNRWKLGIEIIRSTTKSLPSANIGRLKRKHSTNFTKETK